MNVYDWDNTIYRGDSTFGLVLYCYAKRPKSLLSLPRTLFCGLLYGLHLMPKLTFKQNLFHMFTLIPDMEEVVDEFTASHLDHVKQWYKDQQQEDDLVISASPYFLIASFAQKCGIRAVMASPVDIHTGKYNGLNCHGREKVRRFREVYPEETVQEFYSDSYSDTPMALLAEQAWIVKGDERKPWKK